jgi:hypothetical protein
MCQLWTAIDNNCVTTLGIIANMQLASVCQRGSQSSQLSFRLSIPSNLTQSNPHSFYPQVSYSERAKVKQLYPVHTPLEELVNYHEQPGTAIMAVKLNICIVLRFFISV